jgi:hypothetical protein
MKFLLLPVVVLQIACLIGCSKPALEQPKPNNTDTLPSVDTSVVSDPLDSNAFPFHDGNLNLFRNFFFSSLNPGDANQYFSTRDTSFHGPMPKISLTDAQMANVDILYIYDADYDMHGFMSPHTAGQEFYWNNGYYYYPWLSSSHETIFLDAPNLSTVDMNHLVADPSLFDGMYHNLSPTASDGIFPAGTCIGGRGVAYFAKGQVFGLSFDNGKRGFLLIRPDQEYGWPDFPITGFRTKVDLIVER